MGEFRGWTSFLHGVAEDLKLGTTENNLTRNKGWNPELKDYRSGTLATEPHFLRSFYHLENK